MATPPAVLETLADLVEQLGGIPLERILLTTAQAYRRSLWDE
jgi:hypothetical protein